MAKYKPGGKHPKTLYRFTWDTGNTIRRELSRSFDTLDEAQKFARGKQNSDVYVSKGRYKVTWCKETKNPD